MSADEDTELRDLVVHVLETNGVIGKIKAELRASIFMALEDKGSFPEKIPLANKRLTVFASSPEGKQTVSLVREFLEFFNLNFTLAVFDSEVSYSSPNLSKEELAQQCQFDKVNSDVPLITELLNELTLKNSVYKNASYSTMSFARSVMNESEEKVSTQNPLTLNSSSKSTLDDIAEDAKVTTERKDSVYDPFFDEPLPAAHQSVNIFTLHEEVQISKKDVTSKLDTNKSDENFLKSLSDDLRTSQKEGDAVNLEQMVSEKKDSSLFPVKTDSITSLRDFPPLNTKTSVTSDWLVNKSHKKKLPSLKLDSEQMGMNKFDDDNSPTSEQSSKSSIKSVEKLSKPKTDVSDSNEASEQSIEEDLEEEISGVDELLSSISVGDDSTSDQTVSHVSVTGYDHVEKCHSKA